MAKSSSSQARSHASTIETRTPRILIVEDDIGVAETLAKTLRENIRGIPSFFVETTSDANIAFARLMSDLIDIYIVDLTLGDPNIPGRTSKAIGIELVRQIADLSNAGVIVYSSEPSRSDAAALISVGADDYLEKPTPPEIIRSKVFALWRRVLQCKPSSGEVFAHTNRAFKIGKWRFKIGSRILHDESGETVRLSATEHAFLKLISTAEAHEIDKKEFNIFVLGREFEGDRRLDNLVSRLRKKLGDEIEIVSQREGRYKLVNVREIRPLS